MNEAHHQGIAIGVDVGATKIAAACIRRDGQVLAARQTATLAQQGPQAVLERIAAEVNALISGLGSAEAPQLQGVGVGSPGQVLAEQGVVLNAVNMGWQRVGLAAEVRTRLSHDLPVWIEKDANASALGEYYFGAARGCENFAYLGVGSGLGGGLLVDGRLVRGSASNAAEVGHLSLDPHGLPCVCGQRGCAETVASGPGLVNAARRLLAERGPGGSSLAADALTARRILEAAEAGDPIALAALQEAGRALGVVAAACVALLNPERIVIGGGLGAAAFKYLQHSVRDELAQRTLPASHRDLTLAPSELSSPAVGAACLVWYAVSG